MSGFDGWRPAYDEYAAHFTEGRRAPGPDGYHYILPIGQLSIDDSGDGLIIGGAGDGVTSFALRKRESGVWTFNAIDDEWRFCAPTIADFWQGWSDGSIAV